MTTSQLPLDGVRVVDLTRALAGPFCTTLLADLGADVVKVEPLKGDMIRGWGPYQDDVSLYHVAVNRNKRSIALDIWSTAGQDVLRKLIIGADVLVENFRPGVLEAMGLDQDWFAENAADLVLTRISGFGPSGPLSEAPCFDQIAQGMGGLMSVTGTPGHEYRVGVPIADILSGMFAALGVTASLASRSDNTMRQTVETSLLESVMSIMTFQAQNVLSTGTVPTPAGNDHPVISPYGVFQAADRPLNIAAGTPSQFVTLCEILGIPELSRDKRFRTGVERRDNRDELRDEIEKRLVTATAAEWVETLRTHGVPAGPVHDLAGAVADPQVEAMQIVATVEHPELGSVRTVRGPLRINGTATPVRSAAPLLGQHGEEILRELSLTDDEVNMLRRNSTFVVHSAEGQSNK